MGLWWMLFVSPKTSESCGGGTLFRSPLPSNSDTEPKLNPIVSFLPFPLERLTPP